MNLSQLQKKLRGNRHRSDRAALLALALVTPEMLAQAWHIWEVSAPPDLRNMLIAGSGWRWDATIQGYRGPAGNVVSGRELKDLALRVSDALKKKMRDDAMLMIGGAMLLGDWQQQMEANVGGLFIVMAALAAGGFGAASTDPVKETIGGSVAGKSGLSFSLERLKNFADELKGAGKKGREENANKIADRAAIYSDTSNGVFEDVKRESHRQAKDTNGQPIFMFERNILGPNENHCKPSEYTDGCKELSDAGWLPIGSMSLPGTRTCKMACKCHMSYAPAGATWGMN